MKIRKGDTVHILAGKDRGKEGRVVDAMPRDRKVIVENLNIVKRHTRPRPLKDSSRMGGQQDELGLSSIMQVPQIEKITLNMGVGEAKTDAKALDSALDELTTIAGQRAQMRRARKSIASFKVREGMPIGARVTLRGARMWEF